MTQAQAFRKEIDVGATVMDLIILMSEGNPVGLRVLMDIIAADKTGGPLCLLHLDDMNIRGTQIWVGFKDFCGEDLTKFIDCIKTRNADMIEAINKEGRLGNHPHVAVKFGASSGNREFFKGM